MVKETLIRFCPRASDYAAGRGPGRGALLAMTRPAAIDIARRPSSRAFLPAGDFQAPRRYDTVGEALTILTAGQAPGKLRPICGDVMGLVRDGGDYAF